MDARSTCAASAAPLNDDGKTPARKGSAVGYFQPITGQNHSLIGGPNQARRTPGSAGRRYLAARRDLYGRHKYPLRKKKTPPPGFPTQTYIKCLIPAAACDLFFPLLLLFFSSSSSHQTTEQHISIIPDSLDSVPLLDRLEDYGLLLGPPSLTLSSNKRRESANLDLQRNTSSTSTSHPGSPLVGSLSNTTILSSTSLSSLPATIPQFDFQSFTTDNQQSTWLPQPPPSRPPATQQQQQTAQPSDFVLYPAPDSSNRSRHPHLTTLRSHQSASLGLNQRRHSYQPQLQQNNILFGSHLQDPRVLNAISQSNGYPTLSNRSTSIGANALPRSRLYAASAPSNSPQQLARPPVPLFSDSGNNPQYPHTQTQESHRRVMSTSNLPQDFGDILDFTTGQLVDSLDSTAEGSLLDGYFYKQPAFSSVNAPTQSSNGGTVSPSDLMMSAPPSTSFTDLSTPSFESPGCFSVETSPLFADSDLAVGQGDDWESLFPNNESFSAINPEEKKPNVPVRPAPSVSSPMTRTASSPGQSPRNGRSAARRPSSISGVKSRNRDKPLPPIVYDQLDPVAAKRARNTEAARKSRARKLELQDQMQQRINELEQSLEESRQREEYWKSLAENKQ